VTFFLRQLQRQHSSAKPAFASGYWRKMEPSVGRLEANDGADMKNAP
jgi:hypothetical protein